MSEAIPNSSSTKRYNKHFIPLESNPNLFTELIHSLGASEDLSFQDVYSIDDPELFSFIPQPVHALILILPMTPSYEKRAAFEDASGDVFGNDDEVIWLSQTINNACGLYAILHAMANSSAKKMTGIALS
jgi:ubiquitin carboxyl-terminal hydrolase L3